jgi:type IV pilus assembly protein PilX
MKVISNKIIACIPRERGASLMIVLLILLVVSILGVAGAQIALMGERAARNDRDYQVAWQAAEAALLDAEYDIRGPGTATRKDLFANNSISAFVAGCGASTSGSSRGLCLPASTGKPVWLTVDFLSDTSPAVDFGTFTSRAFDAGATGVRSSKKPRYIIEILDDPDAFGDTSIKANKKYVYRITAMGFGPRDDIQAVLQTIFRKE